MSVERDRPRAPAEDFLLAWLGGQHFEQVGTGRQRVQAVVAHERLPVVAVE
jgi:hypothetical protein